MSITSADNIERVDRGGAPALPRRFSLGDWQVLPELNRLRSRGTDAERQLEPRLMKLLCYLVANEDRVLSREELVQELWPRVIVNENSLTRAVSELRKQLQASESTVANYIETIPKRGYRLVPRMELEAKDSRQPVAEVAAERLPFFTLPSLGWGAGLSVACLCLIVASWVSSGGMPLLEQDGEAILLSDEVLKTEPDYLGGELRLSTMEEAPVVQAIASPVVSLDEKQYAFIQYDSNGSTIFLGGLGTAIEPVPVYFSDSHLFNLAWSPIGNNLLFAMQPAMTTAAVFSPSAETAELVMLNLNTLETSRLVEELNPSQNNSTNGLNLT